MPTPEQLRKLCYLSDTVLYPEAVDFMRRFANGPDNTTLPASQVMGLLNIANAESYAELDHFIKHQISRNWPGPKRYIKTFYTDLDKVFVALRKRLVSEFGLLSAQNGTSRQESDELMALLARDFIQHLIAENGLLAVEKAKERAKRR